MKSFFKHALRILIFSLILFIILFVLSGIMTPKSNNKDDGMYDELANGVLSEPENTLDVLFIGDSEVYSGIMPIKLWKYHGITSYDCSTSGQQLAYSLEFLHNTLISQSPKLVIMETNAFYRKLSFDDSIIYKAGMILPVFKYHDRWKHLHLNDFNINAEIEYNYNDTNKGYKFVGKANPADDSKYMTASKNVKEITSRNKSYIKDIKKFCDQNDTELVFLSTPSTKNWNYEKHNGVQELADELGVKFIDMNTFADDLEIDWSKDTYDQGDHMNYYGATKVTNYLGDYFEELGIFTSHKDDKKYSSWDESTKKFYEMLARHLDPKDYED